jgi:site-specific DNA-methyltransferase (adenine-specific)
MAYAIEDAGFEIRDTIMWVYGSGFPKSLDVSKAIDKAAGAKREVIGRKADPRYRSPADAASGSPMGNISPRVNGGRNYARAGFVTAPATAAARQWSGFGTALKPACEPIVLARKPLSESTVAANVLKWGTGSLNIDGCRVAASTDDAEARASRNGSTSRGQVAVNCYGDFNGNGQRTNIPLGRWPANVIHDGSDDVVRLFPAKAGAVSPVRGTERSRPAKNVYGEYGRTAGAFHGDEGSAARFFYCAKASKAERAGSKHPTVKPLKLMRHLVRLVTPPGGIVLDCFAGSGATGQAARAEGFSSILIERERAYVRDIKRRLAA